MDEFPPIPETPSPAMSLTARLFNVFADPGEVFDAIKASPPSTANWLVPTVLLAIVALFSSLLINSLGAVKEQRLEIQDRVLQKMVEKGRMTKEQAERASRDAQAGASGKTLVWQSLWPFVASFVAPFWSALFIWLGGSVIMRGRFSYMRALEVAGLASMIGMLGSIVRALMVVVMGNMFAGPSPAVFIKNFDSFNTWHVALISINLFGLWELGVQASGMAKLSGASYGKSAAWIYGVWIAFATLLIGVSFAFRKLMGF